MLKNATARASLLAEASIMAVSHDIAVKVLKLKNKILSLDTELAELETEERVCKESAVVYGFLAACLTNLL